MLLYIFIILRLFLFSVEIIRNIFIILTWVDITGSNRFSFIYHPHSIGSSELFARVFQHITWKYTLKLCCQAESFVGGKCSGCNPFVDLDTISMHRTIRRYERLSLTLAPGVIKVLNCTLMGETFAEETFANFKIFWQIRENKSQKISHFSHLRK